MIETLCTLSYQVIDLGVLNKHHANVNEKLTYITDENSEGILFYI